MKKSMTKNMQRKNKFITIAYVALAITIPMTLGFSRLIGTNMEIHIQDTMKNAAVLCADIIERQYESDMLLLEGLAVRMASSMESNPEDAIDRLISTADRYDMKRLALSFPDGTTYATDDAEMNLKGINNFELAMTGNSLLTTVIQDVVDNEPVNIYSVPVYATSGDSILGVMSAVYPCASFRDLLSAYTFDGEGYTYIVDSRGNIVIDSNHPSAILGINNDNIFDYMTSQRHKEWDITVLRKNMQEKRQGFFEIKSDHGNRFAYYLPLDVNDWSVLTVVPKNIAEATKKTIMFSVAVYCISISLISLYVVISIRQSQREKNHLLKKALYEDTLTGGRSYEKFKIDCRQHIDHMLELKAICALLSINNFNLIASLYGNEQSNDAIARIYQILLTCVEDKGIVSRSGFSQFCIMYFYDDLKQPEELILQFNKLLRESEIFENMLQPSLGMYVVEDRSESIDDMINKARIALESTNSNIIGHHHTAFYDESFRNAMYEDKHLEDEMVIALDRNEFVPYLQPKYNSETGVLCGAEALIRWITPDGTIVSPGKFIPLAENNGFVRQLDRKMFYMVCCLQKQLLENGISPVPISVNVSRQLMYENSFADEYYNQMTEMQIPINLIELEITESVFFEDMSLFRSTIERLRSYGFRILMDDFGTGYSSLMMLKSIPIDTLKLDKTFVDDYSDPKGSNIIRCVLELAKRLDLPVVAEGVETEHQYHYLKKIGCDVIQGYYFSRPLPTNDFVNKLVS